MTDALITLALFVGMFGIAGVICWIGDHALQRKQQNWSGEGNTRPRW